MATRYIYKGQTYLNAWALRDAIFSAERISYGAPKTTEEFKSLGLDVTVETYDPLDEMSEEERKKYELSQAKEERANAVSKITVSVDGMVFDGDETSQTRMGRTIAAAVALGVDIETYTQTWVLADNTVAQPTIKQLAEALKLAGEAQTDLWTVPYTPTLEAE